MVALMAYWMVDQLELRVDGMVDLKAALRAH